MVEAARHRGGKTPRTYEETNMVKTREEMIREAGENLMRNGDLENEDQLVGFVLAACMLNASEVKKLATVAARMLAKGRKETDRELYGPRRESQDGDKGQVDSGSHYL